MIGFRQQILMTLALLPVTFGLWYSAGGLLAAPASWLAGIVLSSFYGGAVSATWSEQALFVVSTQFGNVDGHIVPAAAAGHELLFEINTRLVSYSIPFYAALLWSSRVADAVNKFALGLFGLWVTMALGLLFMTFKDLMVIVGDPFLTGNLTPPAAVIGLGYQFSVLLAPTLLPVAVWLFQLRGTPLWNTLNERLNPQ